MNNISETIKTLRKRNGLSQEQLAEDLYVSRQAISKWERAEATPDIDTLVLLSEKFGISVDELISGQNILDQQTFDLSSSANDPQNSKQALKLKKQVNILLIVSIALYIVSPLTFLLDLNYKKISWIFAGIILIATIFILIYANLQNKYTQLYEQDKKQKLADNITGAASILATIIFLILGFFFHLWHPGWIVFLFVPFVWLIADLFENKRK